MNINFESDMVELNDDEFFVTGTDVPVHQIISDIAGGLTCSEVGEEYDIEESVLAQLLQDLSECFR